MSSDTLQNPVEAAEKFSSAVSAIKDEISKVVVGQRDVVDQLLISLFSGGHCVLVGVPGLAKPCLSKPWPKR